MNNIWTFIFIIGLALMLFVNPEEIINTLTNASTKAITLCISLLGIYAVWLGLLELVDKTGLNKKLSSKLKGISRFLFGKQTEVTEEQISINLSSNMLGMGNASTPSGIKAMEGLDKKTGKITRPMIMLMIINTTAIQLIPTTIIGLRAVNGSTNPASIVFPTLIATGISTLSGIALVIIIDKFIKKFKRKVKNNE